MADFLSQVCRTIERELGHSMEVLFADFSDEPLATASVKFLKPVRAKTQ